MLFKQDHGTFLNEHTMDLFATSNNSTVKMKIMAREEFLLDYWACRKEMFERRYHRNHRMKGSFNDNEDMRCNLQSGLPSFLLLDVRVDFLANHAGSPYATSLLVRFS